MVIDGIIIRTYHYKEHDAIINILTSKGLLFFFVRNVFKNNNQNILLNCQLLHAKFVFLNSEKNNLIFKEILPINNYFDHINFVKLIAINFIKEVVIYFFNYDDMINIYYYLIETIDLISLKECDNKKILNLIVAFLTISLKLIGFAFNTNLNDDIIGINFSDGCFVRRDNFDKKKHKLYSKLKCQIFKYLFQIKVDNLKNINFPKKEMKEILNDLFKYSYFHTDVHFKSEKLIREFII